MIQGKASIMGGKKLERNELLLLEKAHNLLFVCQYQKIGIGEYVIMIIPQKSLESCFVTSITLSRSLPKEKKLYPNII